MLNEPRVLDEDVEPDALLAIAEEAARAAADALMSRFGPRQAALRSKSTPTDPVSEADIAAESAIRGVIARHRPTDAILGEEGGETDAGAALRWVVDPLDGTVNFLFGIPQWAVSVACEDALGPVAGVVLDPARGEAFTAVRGGPPLLDGVQVCASSQESVAGALIATGFGYDPAVRRLQGEVLARILPVVRDVRRAGAAAIDICWCACGRVDAYYERGIKHWDVAAGGLIAERAGLSVRPLPATDSLPNGLVIAPPAMIDELHALVA